MPRLADVRAMAELLSSFGVDPGHRVAGPSLGEGDTIRLQAREDHLVFASYDMVRKMRASFQVLAPLLARHGEAKVSLPGGCAIGARPVESASEGAGRDGRQGRAGGRLCHRPAPKAASRARTIEFPFVSVGATETAMMAATLAQRRPP